jgi:hypothetical protein
VNVQLHAPAALPPEKSHGTHWIGGWVGHRTGLEVSEKKITPAGIRTPAVQPVARLYTEQGILTPYNFF